jgi:hypothetical protein
VGELILSRPAGVKKRYCALTRGADGTAFFECYTTPKTAAPRWHVHLTEGFTCVKIVAQADLAQFALKIPPEVSGAKRAERLVVAVASEPTALLGVYEFCI